MKKYSLNGGKMIAVPLRRQEIAAQRARKGGMGREMKQSRILRHKIEEFQKENGKQLSTSYCDDD